AVDPHVRLRTAQARCLGGHQIPQHRAGVGGLDARKRLRAVYEGGHRGAGDRRALGRGPSLPGRHRPVGDRPGARHRPTLRPGDDRRGHERHPVRVLRRRERLGRAGEDAEGARTRRRTGPGEIRAESGRVTMTEGDRTERRILIVGHRGAMAHAPENSLESYALAEEIGVDEIELDVRLSADEELFLLHDATLDRTAGDDSARDLGPAADLTLAQLRAVVLDSGRGVVTLQEMYQATDSVIQLEIKAPQTVPHLATFFEAHPEYAARTCLTSFKEDALYEAAQLMPQIPRGIIRHDLSRAEQFDGGWRALVEHTGASRICLGFDGLTEEVVQEFRGKGLELHVWPLRTVDDLHRALELGADGTTADDPALALEWLRELEATVRT